MMVIQRIRAGVMACALAWLIILGLDFSFVGQAAAQSWTSYGNGAQHNALSTRASLLPLNIRWQVPIDLAPQYASGGDLYTHYGSPVITSKNNVLVPIKTLAGGGFMVNAYQGSTGKQLWTLATDYVLPSYNWIPPLGITLTPGDAAVAIAGAGGTVLLRQSPNSANGAVTRLAFFGMNNYNQDPAAFESAIQISTPISCDESGNLYFGYVSSGAALPGYPAGIASGLAMVSATGKGNFVSAANLCGDADIVKCAYNCAPGITADGTGLYIAVNQSNSSYGYLCRVAIPALTPASHILLADPRNSSWTAQVPDDGTASPTVGPDGDVYFGVLEANFPSNHARGWLLHFDSSLSVSKIPGAFGWDDSASIVPRAAVPSYKGGSAYLVLTKYNNYADPGIGGNGLNKVAVLDPNTSMVDPITGATVMNEVLTVLGPTQNPDLPGVNEWCINSAAIDVLDKCAVVNSEDGHVYRWSFVTNTLSTGLKLAEPTGEAYTSTVIGPDGAVYAINNAQLACCDANAPAQGSVGVPPVDPVSRFINPSVQGVGWIGILAALSFHVGIRASRRSRTGPCSFLSRWGVSLSRRRASVASSTAS